MNKTKFCIKCKLIRNITEFSKNKSSKSGYNNWCKHCFKFYREENKEYLKQYFKNKHKKEYTTEKGRESYEKRKIKIGWKPIRKFLTTEERKQKKRIYEQKRYLENKEKTYLRKQQWRKNNPEKNKAQNIRAKKNHPDRINARNNKRRANKLNRTPKWLNKDQLKEIQEFYTLAKELQWLSEEPLHVDHIVPLQGENVSGLHVPWNLQILPRNLNCSKNNKFKL